MTTDDQTSQQEAPQTPGSSPQATMATTGERQVFDNITRTLSDAEIVSPPVVKLILHNLKVVESERDELKKFVPLYYEADKSSAVLQEKLDGTVKLLHEKLKVSLVVEVLYGVGLALGGLAGGYAPYFWDKKLEAAGYGCLLFASTFIVVSVLARMYGLKK